MKYNRIICVLLISILLSMVLPASMGDKGKVATSFVAIQTDVMQDYRYDQDVIFKIRARAYINGIPQRDDIIVSIYDQYGRNLLDTISPNPMTVHAGRVTEINIGRCEVGLYRGTLKGIGAGQTGDLTVQWVVSYPPTDYYFSWFNIGDLFSGASKVKAEFQSNEKYLVTTQVWNENHTRIVGNTTVEKCKPFTLHFYYLDKQGGQKTLKILTDVTSGSWEFDDVHDSGIYCEVTDIHEWQDVKWWLGSRKTMAAPKYPLDRIIIGVLVISATILFVKHVADWNWGIKDKLSRRKKT